MQSCHSFPLRSAVFDDPTLVSHGGLVPAMALAGRAGLGELADGFLTVRGGAGHAAGAKVTAVVAGIVAGADSIADLGALRQGGMTWLLTGVRAPSTLGTFLHAFQAITGDDGDGVTGGGGGTRQDEREPHPSRDEQPATTTTLGLRDGETARGGSRAHGDHRLPRLGLRIP
jgi:hypothetical protein